MSVKVGPFQALTIPVTVAAMLVLGVGAVSTVKAEGCNGMGDNHRTSSASGQTASKYFDQMDANGDQTVTLEEFEASTMAKIINSFDVLQHNENGVVTKDAFIKAFIKTHAVAQNEA